MPSVIAASLVALVACMVAAPTGDRPPRRPGAAASIVATSSSVAARPIESAAVLAPVPSATMEESAVHLDSKLVLSIVDACDTPDVPEDADVVQHLEDVVYATMDGQQQTLDIAWPRTPGVHPLIVIVHGGGWSAGKKELYRKDTLRLATLGYAAATIDYRLATKPRNVFPAGIQDVRCAVRWLRSQAVAYAIDKTRVVAIGASAGAHLAAMLGTERDTPGLDSEECSANAEAVGVSGVVAYYGPYDLQTPSTTYQGLMITAVREFLGVVAEQAPALATLASPIAHVDPGDPPFLFLHGNDDSIVPIDQSRAFDKALRAASVSSLLLEVPGKQGTHGFPLLVTTRPRTTCTTLAFLNAVLRPTTP